MVRTKEESEAEGDKEEEDRGESFKEEENREQGSKGKEVSNSSLFVCCFRFHIIVIASGLFLHCYGSCQWF